MAIEIKNLREDSIREPWDVRVDRGSVLGNPFYMANEAQRDRVCDQYEEWLHARILDSQPVRDELNRLLGIYRRHKQLNLFCWCAPKRCHAESISIIFSQYCSAYK